MGREGKGGGERIEGDGRGGREGEGKGGKGGKEALLVMWPTKLSALNPPLGTKIAKKINECVQYCLLFAKKCRLLVLLAS